jgi:hypothetical protein
MSRNVIVRYRTHPEAADENARLVESASAALTEATIVGSYGLPA